MQVTSSIDESSINPLFYSLYRHTYVSLLSPIIDAILFKLFIVITFTIIDNHYIHHYHEL